MGTDSGVGQTQFKRVRGEGRQGMVRQFEQLVPSGRRRQAEAADQKAT